MRAWILYRFDLENLPPHNYEMPRFVAQAQEMGIELTVIRPDQIDIIVTRDDRKSVLVDGKVTPLPDFLIPRMGASTTYYALAIIRHLERLGVTVINSSTAIEAVRDKLYTQQILAASNLPVPKTMLARFPVNVDLVEKQLGFPVVVKTISGSHGSGVYLSENRDNFADISTLLNSTKPDTNIILQEFIASSHGQDLRVIVVGGRVVACMRRFSTDDNFKANVSRGGGSEPYAVTPEIEMLALESARILELDIAGVDLLFDGDHFAICEVNSSPGFAGMERAHEGLVNIAEAIYQYALVRLGHFETIHHAKVVETLPQ
ncbi:MAG: ATP-grasp domain-containing protein [Anaerolineae bacterium]